MVKRKIEGQSLLSSGREKRQRKTGRDVQLYKVEVDEGKRDATPPLQPAEIINDMHDEINIEQTLCVVCHVEVEARTPNQMNKSKLHQQSSNEILQAILGLDFEYAEDTLCTLCENLVVTINKTKSELTNLQNTLKNAVSKLQDLYSRGCTLLEDDLQHGGLSDANVCVQIVQPNRYTNKDDKNLGLTIVERYKGVLISADSIKKDDGSQLEVVKLEDLMNDEVNINSSIFITTQEWSHTRLSVSQGKVQISEEFVTGIAISATKPKLLLSKGVCADLEGKSFLCLDCDARFERLTELLDHSEVHSDNQNQNVDDVEDNVEVYQDDELHVDENEERVIKKRDEGGNEDRLGVKYAKIKQYSQQATELDVQGSRREFRALMHKAQFKDFENDVATLDKPFQCNECNKCFKSAQELWGHQISFGTQRFDCNFGDCKEEFEKLSDFAVHYASHTGKIITIPQDKEGKQALAIPCPVCNTTITGLYKLQRHKMKHDPELKYKCPACPKQFVKANTMRRHISTIHKGEKYILKCHICHLKVNNGELLSNHLRHVHGVASAKNSSEVGPSVCGKCGLVCSTVYELGLHESNHMTTTATPCTLIPKENGVTRMTSKIVLQHQHHISLVHNPDSHTHVIEGDDEQVDDVTEVTDTELKVYTDSADNIVNDAASDYADHIVQDDVSTYSDHADSIAHDAASNLQTQGHDILSRRCSHCDELMSESVYINHVLDTEKTGLCSARLAAQSVDTTQYCPECNHQIEEGVSLDEHLIDQHGSQVAKFQCSECEAKLVSLQGCRRHYRKEHCGTATTCILCKQTFSTDQIFHQHLVSMHQSVLGPASVSPGQPVQCRYCGSSFGLYMELVIHIRFNHLIETIDIGSTELEEVTMIGGHVVEFSDEGDQIVALHTIP